MNSEYPSITRDVSMAGLQASPGVFATAFTMNGFVAFLTAIFLILQIGYLVWKWRRDLARQPPRPVVATFVDDE